MGAARAEDACKVPDDQALVEERDVTRCVEDTMDVHSRFEDIAPPDDRVIPDAARGAGVVRSAGLLSPGVRFRAARKEVNAGNGIRVSMRR